MPRTKCLGLDKSNAQVNRTRITIKQSIRERVQFSFAERIVFMRLSCHLA